MRGGVFQRQASFFEVAGACAFIRTRAGGCNCELARNRAAACLGSAGGFFLERDQRIWSQNPQGFLLKRVFSVLFFYDCWFCLAVERQFFVRGSGAAWKRGERQASRCARHSSCAQHPQARAAVHGTCHCRTGANRVSRQLPSERNVQVRRMKQNSSTTYFSLFSFIARGGRQLEVRPARLHLPKL